MAGAYSRFCSPQIPSPSLTLGNFVSWPHQTHHPLKHPKSTHWSHSSLLCSLQAPGKSPAEGQRSSWCACYPTSVGGATTHWTLSYEAHEQSACCNDKVPAGQSRRWPAGQESWRGKGARAGADLPEALPPAGKRYSPGPTWPSGLTATNASVSSTDRWHQHHVGQRPIRRMWVCIVSRFHKERKTERAFSFHPLYLWSLSKVKQLK